MVSVTEALEAVGRNTCDQMIWRVLSFNGKLSWENSAKYPIMIVNHNVMLIMPKKITMIKASPSIELPITTINPYRIDIFFNFWLQAVTLECLFHSPLSIVFLNSNSFAFIEISECSRYTILFMKVKKIMFF